MAVAMAQKGGGDPLLKVLSEAESSHSRRLRGTKVGAAWPPEKLIAPLPAGTVVQPPVRSDFLDLKRTFNSLGRDQLSGYVRLAADDLHAVTLLSEGGVVAAVCESGGRVSTGTEAFAGMRRAVETGDGVVDIVRLPAVVLSALHLLYAGAPMYQGLRGRFLNGAEFIDYMSEQALTGGIHVRSEGRSAVVLLHDGVLGAYNGRTPEMKDSLDPVMELLGDPDCEVSVNGGTPGATLPLMIL